MSGSIFNDKTHKPDSGTLAKALGETAGFWEDIRVGLEEEHGELVEDWKFYGQKIGWTLKLLRKKRNLFFMTPQNGFFHIAFVFGDRAVAEVERSGLPESIKDALRTARKYAEGRGLQIDVTSADDIELVRKLARIKVAN
jgi:hypothetical protein